MARQYTGTAGKITSCQVAVSLSLVTETAACPVDWQLFLPEAWDPASPEATADVALRRRRAQIPEQIGHTPKWRLALARSTNCSAGARAPGADADAGYGDAGEFRQALTEHNIDYVADRAHHHCLSAVG